VVISEFENLKMRNPDFQIFKTDGNKQEFDSAVLNVNDPFSNSQILKFSNYKING
jgi:hypothetical protein